MSKQLEKSIHAAADALAANGVPVSVRAVRSEIGGGSFRDIGKHLVKWREIRAAEEKIAVTQLKAATPAEIPAKEGFIPLEEHTRALEEMEDRMRQERLHLMIETDAIRQGLAAPHLLKIRNLQRRVGQLERSLLLAGLSLPGPPPENPE